MANGVDYTRLSQQGAATSPVTQNTATATPMQYGSSFGMTIPQMQAIQNRKPVAASTVGGTGSTNNNSLIVDPTNQDPHALAAKLLNAQFQEWQQTFEPIELQAMQEVSFNNPAVLPAAVQQASQAATGASGAMAGVLQRENRALGVTQTPQQQQTQGRILNLSQAQAQAGAENLARANVRTQDEQLLLGEAPNLNIVKGAI